jgi:hypothetical protein
MAEQYQEGQRLKGSDGKTYIVQGGVPREEITPPNVQPILQRAAKTEKPTATFRDATTQEKIDARVDPNMAYQINEATNQLVVVGGQTAAKPTPAPDTNRLPQIYTGLSAVNDLRKLSDKFLAVGKQAGNISETPVLGSLLGQNRANVEGSVEILKGIIIQDQLARLSKINPAGVTGLANSPSEQERFVSAIANLNPDQSPEQFAIGLQRAEDYLNRQLKESGGEAAAAPEAGPRGAPALQVAQGDRISTDRDIEIASLLQGAWQSGKSIDEVNALAIQLGTEPLPPETIQALQSDPNRQIRWTPNRSGVREGSASQMGTGAALAAGAVRGFTGNLAEEALSIVSPEAAAKLQAAGEAAQQEAPFTTMAGEVIGGALSPLSRIGPGGTIAGEAVRGGIYGGLYGAGEAAPDAAIMERVLPAVVGLTTGAGTGALAQRFLGGGGNVAPAPDGGVVPPVAGVVPEVPAAGMAAPIEAAAPPVAAVAPEEAAAELGTLINKASGTGGAAKNAQIKLAEQAQINPEAKAAAERLGIDVPADVFSDNPQVRAAVGLTRSLAGSEAEAGFRTAVTNAVDQADNIMREFDAQFVEGAIAPGVVSQRVKDSLTTTRADLNKQASEIYKRVDAAVPKQTPVQLDNLFNTLTDIAGEVGQEGMTAPEKKLLSLFQTGEAGGGDITYGRLIREKNLIGKALKRQESPYGSMDEATLKRLYAALASDQLDNVSRVAGEEVRRDLRAANLIYAKERALGDRIVNAFGTDLEGGIANKMRSAITSGAKGEAGDFARLLKTVPDDLRKEVVATALASVTRSARGAEKGSFGFSEFADIYPKLRANPQVYKQIVETLGPKASDTLRDLYQVSKRITEARANVLTTGKANQALVESLNAEGIIARVMGSTAGKRAVGGAMGFIPGAGLVMPEIMEAMSRGNPDAIRAAGKMFSSPEFQGLLNDVATKGDVSDRVINQVSLSKPFRSFIATIGIKGDKAKDYLKNVVKSAPATTASVVATETTGPEATLAPPTVEMPQ